VAVTILIVLASTTDAWWTPPAQSRSTADPSERPAAACTRWCSWARPSSLLDRATSRCGGTPALWQVNLPLPRRGWERRRAGRLARRCRRGSGCEGRV